MLILARDILKNNSQQLRHLYADHYFGLHFCQSFTSEAAGKVLDPQEKLEYGQRKTQMQKSSGRKANILEYLKTVNIESIESSLMCGLVVMMN